MEGDLADLTHNLRPAAQPPSLRGDLGGTEVVTASRQIEQQDFGVARGCQIDRRLVADRGSVPLMQPRPVDLDVASGDLHPRLPAGFDRVPGAVATTQQR